MNPRIRMLTRWRALRDPQRRQDGMVTAFTVIIIAALVLFAGLALDGGLALDSRIKAIDEAQEAARAGAQALDVAAYRSGGHAVLDPAAAVAAANAYLAETGDSGTVQVEGAVVTVSVTRSQRTRILSIAGIDTMTARETASATAEQGN